MEAIKPKISRLAFVLEELSNDTNVLMEVKVFVCTTKVLLFEQIKKQSMFLLSWSKLLLQTEDSVTTKTDRYCS